MNVWNEIDKELFSRCMPLMKRNEIIVSQQKIKGITDENEKIEENKNDQLPKSEIQQPNHIVSNINLISSIYSVESIASIITLLLNIQIDFMNGRDSLQTLLDFIDIIQPCISINPILDFVIKCILNCVLSINKYIISQVNQLPVQWYAFDEEKLSSYFVDIEKLNEQLKHMKLSSNIENIVWFELDLINFLNNVQNQKFRTNFDDMQPEKSPCCMHLLALYNSSIKFTNEKEIYAILNKFLIDINYIQNLATNVSIASLFHNLYQWNENSDHLALIRIIARDIVIGNSDESICLFGKMEPNKFIENDLKPLGLSKHFCSLEEFEDVSFIFISFMIPVITALVSPLDLLNDSISNQCISNLHNFQEIAYHFYEDSVPSNMRPKCASQAHQRVIEQAFVLWNLSISTELFYISCRSSFICSAFKNEELYIAYYLMKVVLAYEFSAQDQLRIISAVEICANKQKSNKKKSKGKPELIRGNDVEQNKKEQSQETKLSNILASYFSGLVDLFKYLMNEKAIDDISPENYNEEELFMKITSPIQNILHVCEPSYEEFTKSLELPQDALKDRAAGIFLETKNSISELIKKGFESSLADPILQSIVSANIILMGYTQGMKVKILPQKSFLYPIFEFTE